MTHELKTWPAYFEQTKVGIKKFEIRKYDRNFQVGDLLQLREYNLAFDEYTGNELTVEVTSILNAFEGANFGLQPEYCIMSINPIN